MNSQDIRDTITIDLTERLDVRSLKIGEFIHIDALKQLISNIDEIIAKSTLEKAAKCSEFITNRRHETITIQGSRGSGKTTFIRNALDWLNSPSGDFEKIPKFKDVAENVVPLSVIDPTLIENKENFLVLVLSEIVKKVEQCNEYKGLGADGRLSKDIRYWREKLKKLAEGLSLLDGVGSDSHMGEAWDDANYILEKGLSQAKNSMSLERNFHEFIEDSLKIIGNDKKAFILAIDDVDTDFRRGWPVLETLRRYLTSSHLIVILSGDIELYSILVRNNIWKNFDKQFLDRDLMVPEKNYTANNQAQNRGHNLMTMIDHIQGQYLLKVLPTQRRVELPNLDLITGKPNVSINVITEKHENNPELLASFLETLSKKSLNIAIPEDVKKCREFMLRQPIRSVLQILAAFQKSNSNSEPFSPLIISIFIDVLGRFGVSGSYLNMSNGRFFLMLLVDILQENNLWADGHNLFINNRDDDQNSVLFLLGVKLFEEIKNNIGLSLEYGLRICVVREIFESNLVENRDREEAIKFLRLDSNETPLQIARRMAPLLNKDYLVPTTRSSKAMKFGVVRLDRTMGSKKVLRMYGDTKNADSYESHNKELAANRLQNLFNSNANIPIFIKKYYEKINEVTYHPTHLKGKWYNNISDIKIEGGCSSFIRLPSSELLRSDGEGGSLYSIYNLIASIIQLLSITKSESDEFSDDDLVRELTSMATIRTYPEPHWVNNKIANTEEIQVDDTDLEESDKEGEIEFDKKSELFKNLKNWISKSHNLNINLPPKAIAAIFTRLHYTLNSMRDVLKQNQMYLGFVTYRMVIAFLNSVLVEELRERKKIPQLKNPISTSDLFVVNLKIAEIIDSNGKIIAENLGKIKLELPFFYSIFTCPIWGAFFSVDEDASNRKIRTNRVIWDAYLKLNKLRLEDYEIDFIIKNEKVKFPNLYDVLNSIPTINLNNNAETDSRSRKSMV